MSDKPKNKMSDVAFRVYEEGLGYAIREYYGCELNSESDDLNRSWAEAYDSMAIVESLLPEVDDGEF